MIEWISLTLCGLSAAAGLVHVEWVSASSERMEFVIWPEGGTRGKIIGSTVDSLFVQDGE